MGFLLNDDPTGIGVHPYIPVAPEPAITPHQGLADAISSITSALGTHGQSFRERVLEQQLSGRGFAPAKQVLQPNDVTNLLGSIPQRTAAPTHSNLLGLFQRAGHTMQLNPQHQPQLNPFQHQLINQGNQY